MEYVWSDSNPHCNTPRQHQKKFSVNIWAGILGDYVVGPYILPDRLTSATYRIFLQQVLPSLLQAVPLMVSPPNMWFMHGGTTAYCSRTVRHFLNATYSALWLGLIAHRTSNH
ncbi:hypothetical protein AVEN_82568-1 [Araneus ventricosus]|uniref:Uncharacterized protein n=1 Tax=Araneus ventricosus TaxID=182803 RepID=A0A4Y2WGM9_ARAVE|nr:hypothetical protein AVEN_82568-1 [Araneus ventricosus]